MEIFPIKIEMAIRLLRPSTDPTGKIKWQKRDFLTGFFFL